MSTDLGVTQDAVRSAIASVVDPCSIATGEPVSLIEMGMLQRVDLDGGHVVVTLIVTSPICWQSMNIIEAVQRAVGRVSGVERVICRIDPTGEWLPQMMSSSAQARLRRRRPIRLRETL